MDFLSAIAASPGALCKGCTLVCTGREHSRSASIGTMAATPLISPRRKGSFPQKVRYLKSLCTSS